MSTCIYMAAISINDSFMMFFALHDWLSSMQIFIMNSTECKLSAFFISVILQNSTYQVLAMTTDKYIAIKWPHQASIYSTPERARNATIVIIICVLIYNIPHLFLSKLVGMECLGYSVGGVFTKVYSMLSFCAYAVIPFVMLIYMNYIIVQKVRSSRKMFAGNGSHENVQRQGKPQTQSQISNMRQKSMKNTEHQLTIMLLLVTILFMILMIPTYLRYVYTNFAPRDTPANYASLMLFYHISHKLYTTNNGINFFLYCISGQKFRNDLKEILGFKRGLDLRNSVKETPRCSVTDISIV